MNSRSHLNPVMFFNLHSREESHGKSFRNFMECRFLFSFLLFLAPKLKNYSIGIITPYKSQVDLIRKEIHNLRHGTTTSTSMSNSGIDSSPENMIIWKELLIDVNTVDGYQGKEKDFIILSTVRTRSIGFLSDQRRLNVAITRAKRCLIIIGNEQLLQQDPIWNHMLLDFQQRNIIYQAPSDDFKRYSGYMHLQYGIYGIGMNPDMIALESSVDSSNNSKQHVIDIEEGELLKEEDTSIVKKTTVSSLPGVQRERGVKRKIKSNQDNNTSIPVDQRKRNKLTES